MKQQQSPPVSQLAEHYYAALQTEGKTAKTLIGYREKLGRFVRWLDGDLEGLTLQRAREFIAALLATEKWQGNPKRKRVGEPLSVQTVANHARVMKAFATWLWEEEYTEDNRFARLVLPKAPRKLTEVLSADEIQRLLAAIDVDFLAGTRDLAIIVLFLDTGLRLSELLGLELLDVHIENQWLKVMGKGKKERFVPFGTRACQALMRYLQHGRYDPFERRELFLTADGEAMTQNAVRMLFKRLRVRSGIVRLHPHLLRHTFATQYLVAGGDVFTLQTILGHTTLEMTRRYVTLASSQINIQHRRFSPMDRLESPALRSRRGHIHTSSARRRDATDVLSANGGRNPLRRSGLRGAR
jgi:integrase/recombinase XerC/integrase/recombinase XerD